MPDISSLIVEIGAFKLFISCGFYLFSHFLRSLRIAVMLGRQNYSLTNLIAKQYYTNGINLIFPFKLGEFYRILEFNKLVGDYNTSLITVIAERSIDFLILFSGLFLSLLFLNYQLIQLEYTIIIGCIFIFSVLFIYYVLPENIKAFNLFIAKRYNGKWVISVLSKTSRLYHIILNLKDILSKRYSTVIALSLLIWGSEVFGFYYVFGYLASYKILILLAFLVFLSSIIPSGSMGLGGLQLAFFLISNLDPAFKYLEFSFIYQLFVFLPAILIGFIIYLFSRVKKPMEVRNLISLSVFPK